MILSKRHWKKKQSSRFQQTRNKRRDEVKFGVFPWTKKLYWLTDHQNGCGFILSTDGFELIRKSFLHDDVITRSLNLVLWMWSSFPFRSYSRSCWTDRSVTGREAVRRPTDRPPAGQWRRGITVTPTLHIKNVLSGEGENIEPCSSQGHFKRYFSSLPPPPHNLFCISCSIWTHWRLKRRL